MITLLQYLALSTGILSLAFGVYWIFFKRDAYHSWSRHLLLSGAIASLVVPLGLLYVNTLEFSTAVSEYILPEVVLQETQQIHHTVSAFEISTIALLIGYALGLIFFTYKFTRQLLFIQKLKRSAQIESWQGLRVYVLEDKLAPFSFGKSIFIGKEEFEKQNHSLLLHESIHIQEKHSIDILFMQTLQIVFWFNPLYILYKKELQVLHEYICDQKTISQIPETEYRIALLRYKLTAAGININHSFNQLNLKRRLSIMKKQKSGRLTLKALLMVPVLGLGILLMSAMLPNEVVIQENLVTQELKPIAEQIAVTNKATETKVVKTQVAKTVSEEEVVVKQEPESKMQEPTFPGGKEAMMAFITTNIKYPEVARQAEIEGTVYVSFVVKKSGKVKKVSLKRGIANEHAGARAIEAEALRVVESMPKWNPATKGGKAISIQMTIPIKFQLS